VPGFRKGKIPKQIIDTQVGEEVVLEEFVHQQVPTYFRAAVGGEDLAPITEPQVDVEQLEKGKPFIFTATVEVRPRLALTSQDYEGLKVERPSVAVSESDIDAYVDRLRERFSELEPAERPIQDGDFATVDVKAEVDGEALEDATRTDYLYFVGSGEFGEQLDAQLPGKKPGDIVTTTEPLPERFEDRAGQQVSFTVLIKDVKARKLPEADDAFAKTASEFDTLQQLREDLRERLGELKEREATKVIRDRALQAMVDTVEEDIPESLVEDETAHRVTHAGERAKQMGISLEQMLETQGVARTAKLEVTAEEIGAEINALAQAYGRDPKGFAKQLDRSGEIVTLAGDIIRTKALDLLVEHADIHAESDALQEPEPGSSKETE